MAAAAAASRAMGRVVLHSNGNGHAARCISSLSLKNPSLFREGAYINGEWIDKGNRETFEVQNPATGETLANLPALSKSDVQRAIDSASEAWPAWRAKTVDERCKYLWKMLEIMKSNQDDLAYLLAAESGKAMRDAKGEINYAASFIEYYASVTKAQTGQIINPPMSDRRLLVLRQSVGPAALITPWNFPSAMITRKLAPALAAGCDVVIKPAAETPLSALALAKIAEEAGVPPGVVNVLTAPSEKAKEVGELLAESEKIRKISFTGSTGVGSWLMEHAASTVKKVSFELGGNAPFIVFADADVDLALSSLVAGKFRCTGQTCVCPNRVFVQREIFDDFSRRLVEKVEKLRWGNPLDDAHKDYELGSLIHNKAVEKVDGLVQDAVKRGARCLTGGKVPEEAQKGNFYLPTVLTDIPEDADITSAEIFGPVVALYPFDSEEEVLVKANETHYGLAAYFYTSDMSRSWRVSERIESGMVGVNECMMSTTVAPFGGVKRSGLGVEGSMMGLEEYQDVKYVCMGALQV